MHLFSRLRSPVRTCWRRLVGDQSGNMAMIFALVLVPTVGAVALAVDYGRASHLRNQMQQAADSAAFAAARNPDMTDAEVGLFARAAFRANMNRYTGGGTEFSATRDDDGITITVSSSVDTMFAKAIGQDKIDISVTSGAMSGTQDLELALVLDNTGSMRDFMGDLKSAAKQLVETVHGGAGRNNPRTKVALVPYVGAVNIGNGPAQMAWMDSNADSATHGITYERESVGFDRACYDALPVGPPGPPDPGPGPGGGGNDRSSLETMLRSFAALSGELFGVRSAKAASPPAPADYLYGYDGNCFLLNPAKVNHFTLFNQIPNSSWKGCVEARPAPFDVDDTPPDLGDPNTLFVPFLWPDEPDVNVGWADFPNHYLADGSIALFAPGLEYEWETKNRLRNVYKYDGTAAVIDEVGPLTKGPNASCPDPIVPLTSNVGQVNSAIDALSHWEGSGTVSSEGVAWGLRVLSPTEPFTEGRAFGDVQKIMILMTDGKNWAAEQADWATRSDYTAYGYLYGAASRIVPPTYETYKTHIDDRTLAACTNAKAAGITVYTITFGVMDAATEALYVACASEPPFHYSATTVADLHDAFTEIGGRIMALRLTK